MALTDMYETHYHRASSVEDAAALFAKGSDSKFLAGGQTLLPVMKQRLAAPTDVVDLARIPAMIGVEVSGDTVTIKAATTHYDVASNAALQKAIPALAALAGMEYAGVSCWWEIEPAARRKGPRNAG